MTRLFSMQQRRGSWNGLLRKSVKGESEDSDAVKLKGGGRGFVGMTQEFGTGRCIMYLSGEKDLERRGV